MLFLLLLSFIPFALWLCRAILHYRRLLRVSTGIYSPPALPLIGHLHLLPNCRYEWIPFLIDQSNQAMREGHRMIRWWVATKLCVWMLDADAAKAILENSVELRKGRDYAFFGQWLGQGLLLSDGTKWRRQRRMLTPTFHFAMLEQYTHIFNRHARALVDRMDSLADMDKQEDISPLLIRCSLNIVAEAIMGVRLDSDAHECVRYVDCVKQFNDLAHDYTTSALYTFFPVTWWLFGRGTDTRRCVRMLKTFTHKVIEERIKIREEKQRNPPSKVDDEVLPTKGKAFLDLLLEMEENKLDREELREQVDTFMFEGHDTTAHGLMWTLWCLATHPVEQQRVHAELVAVLDDANEDLDSASLHELHYLDRCIREAMRLFPPVPVLERDLCNDVRVGNLVLPGGSMVLVSPMIAHHNEQVYPLHWEFDPDNFLPEAVAARNSFDYIPFSAGPRNCIGQKFAQLELKILLAHILRHFRLSSDVPFRHNRPAMEAILRPELGLPVRVHPI